MATRACVQVIKSALGTVVPDAAALAQSSDADQDKVLPDCVFVYEIVFLLHVYFNVTEKDRYV